MLCTRGIYYKKSGQRNNKNKKKTWWRTLNTMENALRRQSHSIGGGRGGHSIVLVPVFLALGRLWTSCRFSHDDLRRERWREETYEWPSKWLRTSWGMVNLLSHSRLPLPIKWVSPHWLMFWYCRGQWNHRLLDYFPPPNISLLNFAINTTMASRLLFIKSKFGMKLWIYF